METEVNEEQVIAVNRMQSYIEEHLDQTISLYDLSRVAGYSPCYSARLFKHFVGYPPFEYIRMMRLSKAALRMRDTKCKVIDVAFDFVFDSHEGFTRAFTKEFGINPKVYQTHKPPIKLFLPYPVKDYYEYLKKGRLQMNDEINNVSKVEKERITVFTQVIEKPKRRLILKRGIKADEYYGYCEEVGCDVWGILTSVKEALYEPMGMWLPKSMIPIGTSEYVQGVEVPYDYKGQIPEGFELIELEAEQIMVFQGPKYDDEVFEDAIMDVMEAIKEYDPTLYGFRWNTESPRFQLEPQGYRGYIEGIPVVKLNR